MPPNLDYLCILNCCNSYADNPAPLFDDVYFSGKTDDVWCGIKFYDDCIIVTFRGSTTIQDWFRDFEAFDTNDPDLGLVHKGFMDGLRDTYAFLYNQAQSNPGHLKIVVTGHSLGAARALLFGALLTCYNIPCEVAAFGAPHPGGEKVKDILSKIPVRIYRNRIDPVTYVPSYMLAPCDYTHINIAPPLPDGWGILADHHSELYLQALKPL